MITVNPTPDKIASCLSCTKPNYFGGFGTPRPDGTDEYGPDGTDEYGPNGLVLFDITITRNQQAFVTKLCGDCLQKLSQEIFPHRTGL